ETSQHILTASQCEAQRPNTAPEVCIFGAPLNRITQPAPPSSTQSNALLSKTSFSLLHSCFLHLFFLLSNSLTALSL
ncbi:hypothetical protein KUCAC02_019568, partial [Chaenocephalus aceratus]